MTENQTTSNQQNNLSDVISPAQCRAGRALVRLSQAELAQAAEVATKTIADFEREVARGLQRRTLRAIQAALEAAGVEFIPRNGGGPGVRLRTDAGGAGHAG